MALDKTLSKLKALLRPPHDAGTTYDAALVRRTFGLDLPEDYRMFVESFGDGVIDDWMYVLTPGSPLDGGDICQQFVAISAGLRECREQTGIPYSIYPEPGGLIGWAVTSDGDTMFWKTGNADPNKWPIVVAEAKRYEWAEFDGSMTAFLYAVFAGEFECAIFSEDYPTEDPRFEPG